MNKKTWIIIAIIIAAFSTLVGFSIASRPPKDDPRSDAILAVDCDNLTYDLYSYDLFERSLIKDLSTCIDYSGVDPNKEIAASEASGNLPENTKGPKDAPITIVEFFDYQCTHCAERNATVNKLLSKYPDKIRFIFRSYLISYNEKGTRAAAAAEAAAIQGYWSAYKDLVFDNQNGWYTAGTARFQTLLENYFKTASAGQGNLEQFRADMKSAAVARKLAYDMGLGTLVELEGTPMFLVNGEPVKPGALESYVEDLINNL